MWSTEMAPPTYRMRALRREHGIVGHEADSPVAPGVAGPSAASWERVADGVHHEVQPYRPRPVVGSLVDHPRRRPGLLGQRGVGLVEERAAPAGETRRREGENIFLGQASDQQYVADFAIFLPSHIL